MRSNPPWYIEMWMCSTIWVLLLMTGLFWKEVLEGRYNPEFWDKEGDDEKLPLRETPAPRGRRVRKKSVYDLIDLDLERKNEDGSDIG